MSGGSVASCLVPQRSWRTHEFRVLLFDEALMTALLFGPQRGLLRHKQWAKISLIRLCCSNPYMMINDEWKIKQPMTYLTIAVGDINTANKEVRSSQSCAHRHVKIKI